MVSARSGGFKDRRGLLQVERPCLTTRPFFKIILLLFSVNAFAQEPPSVPATARVAALRDAKDVEGLSTYALALIEAYHGLQAVSAEQDKLIAELKADRARWEASLAAIQQALVLERQAREKMATRLAGLAVPRWKQVLGGGATGVSVGGAVGRNSQSALIGGGIGTLLQWIITRKGK